MPDVEIVCLANSRKLSGRCVAGLRTDGSGWLRPVTAGTGEIGLRHCVLDDESLIQVLDVVQMNLGAHVPREYQPEDWEMGDTPWALVERPGEEPRLRLVREAVQEEAVIFGTTGDRLSVYDVEESPPGSSLTLVRPENLEFHWAAREYGRRARVSFDLGENHYDLAVTDPSWEQRIKDLEEGPHGQTSLGFEAADDIVLTVSLGEPFSSYHYKLVAAIIPLPPATDQEVGDVAEIRLKTEDLERLQSVEGQYGFSCNEYGEVWPSVVHGLTPNALRHHLAGKEVILDRIVRLVIGARPAGGRFYLADEGVRLSGSHELVSVFHFE